EMAQWSNDCGGWESSIGPELSIAVGTVSLVGLAIGVIMVTTKGRLTLNHESRSPVVCNF
ncbi:MAG: hypothetical protein ACREBU_21100, partial [Nitrososphaera sp.]